MKKLYGIIVAIIILMIASTAKLIIKTFANVYQEQNIDTLSQFAYVTIGLLDLIPLVIGIWLVRISWRKITAETEDEIKLKEVSKNNNNSKQSLAKAVVNHSKEIINDIKPTINNYIKEHNQANSTMLNNEVYTTSINDNSIVMTEDEIYEQVMLEIEEDKKIKSAWAKALSQSGGDKSKAESIYINLRVNSIIKLNEYQKKEIKKEKRFQIEENKKILEQTDIVSLNEDIIDYINYEIEDNEFDKDLFNMVHNNIDDYRILRYNQVLEYLKINKISCESIDRYKLFNLLDKNEYSSI